MQRVIYVLVFNSFRSFSPRKTAAPNVGLKRHVFGPLEHLLAQANHRQRLLPDSENPDRVGTKRGVYVRQHGEVQHWGPSDSPLA